MIIRSQQQQQQQHQNNNLQNSGSCSPVPGNIAPILSNEEGDMYLLNNPYEYRNSNGRYNANANSTATTTATNNHSYNIYPSDNHSSSDHHFSSPYESHTSPYLHSAASTNRTIAKPAADKEEEKRSIDFPSSPPPESSATHTLKYSGSNSPYPLNNTNSSPPSWSESNNDSSTNRKSPLGKI